MKITITQLRRIIKEEAAEAQAKNVIQNEIKPELKDAIENWVEENRAQLEAFYQENPEVAAAVVDPNTKQELTSAVEDEIKQQTSELNEKEGSGGELAMSGLFLGPIATMALLPNSLTDSLANSLGRVDPLLNQFQPEYFGASAVMMLSSMTVGVLLGALADVALNKLGKKKNESVRITTSQLRKIIKEEITKSLMEANAPTVEDVVSRYKSNSTAWNMAQGDFDDMANGGDGGGIRDQYYSGWQDQDFQAVLDAMGE